MPDAMTLAGVFPTSYTDDLDGAPPTDNGLRWGRVLCVVALFWAIFYYIDHDAASFAGLQVSDNTEDRIADTYIDEIEDGSSLRKLTLTAYGLIGLSALYFCRDRPWNVQWGAASMLLLFAFWVMASFVWSIDPGLTFRRIVATGMIVVGSLGFARMLRPDEILSVALITFAAFVGYSLLLDVGAGGRPWEKAYRFGGTLHPNIQAAYCGILCLAAFCQPTKLGGRGLTTCLFIFGFVMLIQTQSRTSAFAVLVGLTVTFLVRLTPGVRWWTVWVVLAMASAATILISSLGDGDRKAMAEAALLGRTEQAGSLTGRVPLWQDLARFAGNRPLAGHGYESFWTPDNIAAVMKSQKWALQSAHNAYFEVVLQLGLVGLTLAVAMLLSSFNLLQTAYGRTQAAGYAFAYGVLGFAITNSLLESHFAKLKYPTVLAMIAVLGAVAFFPQASTDTEAHGGLDGSAGSAAQGGLGPAVRRRRVAGRGDTGGRRIA